MKNAEGKLDHNQAERNPPRKQTGSAFRPGQSGNPAGRPKGRRNKATVLIEQLLDDEAEKIARRAVEMAMSGDTTAMRLCLERIVPPRKDRPIEFEMPELRTAADAVKATSAIVRAVSEGQISPVEATELSRLVEGFTRAYEASELEARLDALEQKVSQ